VFGAALALGGLIAALGWLGFGLLDPRHERTTRPSWLPLNLTVVLGGVFVAMGLPGVYLAQSEQVGWLGLVGFVVLFVGIVVPYAAVQAVETATSPAVPPVMRALVAIGAPSLFIGASLTAVATIVAGVYPVWQPVALIVVGLLAFTAQHARLPPLLTWVVFPTAFALVLVALGLTTVGLGAAP
jgi:hypothetical protein